MVGLSDFISGAGMWGASTDDLIRAAQAGSLPAYKELINRGEMFRSSRTPLPPMRPGITRNMGRPASDMIDTGDVSVPPYLQQGISRNMARPAADAPDIPGYMDRGADNPGGRYGNTTRDMARPSNSPDYSQQPLDFMSALGMPQAPDYLGTSMMTPGINGAAPSPGQRTPQQRLSKIANGGDIAGTIQAGSAAADADAGIASPTQGLPDPIASLSEAFANSEAPEDETSQGINDLIKKMMAGTDPAHARNMALAQAGFAMAASGSPTFFGGLGAGGLAGMKAYQDQEREDMANRIAGGRLASEQQRYKEDYRSHRRNEALDVAKHGETVAENVRQDTRFQRTQAETERHNRESEADNRASRALSARGYDLEAERLQLARDTFNDTKARADRGEATKEELDQADIALKKAQADSQRLLGVQRSTESGVDDQGYSFTKNIETGKVTYDTDAQGNKVKAQPKGGRPSATEIKLNVMRAAGMDDKAIADVYAGKRQMSAAEKMNAASAYASRMTAGNIDAITDPTIVQDFYDDAMTALNSASGAPAATTPPPAAATPSTQGPSKQAPTTTASAPPVPGARKAPDGNWYVPDPNRPGKYLKVE